MGTIKETFISTFDRLMSNDKRSLDTRKFALASNFDAFSFPHKLVPRPGFATKTVDSVDIVKTMYVDRGGSFELIGLDVSSNNTKVLYWSGTAWLSHANNVSGIGRKEDVFFEYKNYTYMFSGTTKLVRYDSYDSSDAFNDSYQTLTAFTDIAQPVHHPTDDNAYFFTDNLVYRLDDTSWDGLVLTLPTNLKIVQGASYGNYLAIACVTKQGIREGASSIVYLWDRDSSLTTITERVDFGKGVIRHMAILDNKIIVVMDTEDDKKIVIKERIGITSRIINEIELNSQQVHYKTREIINNRLYFPMEAPLRELGLVTGNDRIGIWVVDALGRINLEIVVPDFTTFDGIYWTGDTWWVCGAGVVKASDSTINATSVYETNIFRNGNNNKLVSASVMISPQASLTENDLDLEYKTDGGAWTTIYENKSVTKEILFDAVNIESSGLTLPQFREIEFRVTVRDKDFDITGLKFKYEEINDDLC